MLSNITDRLVVDGMSSVRYPVYCWIKPQRMKTKIKMYFFVSKTKLNCASIWEKYTT